MNAQAATSDEVLTSLARAGQRHGLDPLADRLGELSGWLADDLMEFERALSEIQQEQSTLAARASSHLLEQPGKRIRPLCVMLAARLGERTLDPPVRNLAVAAELVHAATLLHDDVIDEGTQRRGYPASRMVYGNSASILGGDHLLIKALQLIDEVGAADLLRSMMGVISEMVAAEARQLERRGTFDPSRTDYLHIVRGKTAALFRWGLVAGGTLGGLEPEAIVALGEAGVALGTAFQLVDDVLDVAGKVSETGKDSLNDLREGKLTWPMLIAAERDPATRRLLQAVATDQAEPSAEIMTRVRESIRRCGAVEAAREFAQEQGQLARWKLAALPESAARLALESVVDAAVHRSR